MQTKSEIQPSNEILHFKSNEIENSIKKYGYYKDNKITIYQLLDFDEFLPQDEYIPPNEDLTFALENKDENIPFLGVVNFNFKRFGFCLNTFINGDIYFGNYYKDVISKKGFYSYKAKIENDYNYPNIIMDIGKIIYLKEMEFIFGLKNLKIYHLLVILKIRVFKLS